MSIVTFHMKQKKRDCTICTFLLQLYETHIREKLEIEISIRERNLELFYLF